MQGQNVVGRYHTVSLRIKLLRGDIVSVSSYRFGGRRPIFATTLDGPEENRICTHQIYIRMCEITLLSDSVSSSLHWLQEDLRR